MKNLLLAGIRRLVMAVFWWSVLLAVALLPVSWGTASAATDTYDVVIVKGRVLDPESQLDAIRNLGIVKGTIQAVTTDALHGRKTIDASGLVVAPGFIDLHSHGQAPANYALKAMDGVTTALELELGTDDVDRWYMERDGHTLINYGVSAGHIPVRMKLMSDPGPILPTGDAARKSASVEELEKITRQITQGLTRGALGVGLVIQLTPAASAWEILELFRVAARFQSACYVHLRYKGELEPESSVRAGRGNCGSSDHESLAPCCPPDQ
jgi:hypothetical protein